MSATKSSGSTRCPRCGELTSQYEARCVHCDYKIGRAGARRWWYRCDCNPELAKERRTQKWVREHLEITESNAYHHVDEERVGIDDVDALKEIARSHETLLVCKTCRTIRGVD